MKPAAEILSTLPHFSGTNEWFPYMGILLTEGLKYLCESADCFWLAGIVASLRHVPQANAEEFLTIHLSTRGSRAVFRATDGGKGGAEEKQVYRQFIDYTDMPLKEVKLFFRDGVLMLPSEY